MKWINAASVTAWALSGVIFVIAANVNQKESSAINVVDSKGNTVPLDAVLPAGEIGLITVALEQVDLEFIPDEYDMASGANDDVKSGARDDGRLTPPKPEVPKPKPESRSPSSKTSSSKSSSSKSPSRKSAAAQTAAAVSADLPCVDVNTAAESDLVTLKGIGPAIAAQIIEHRAAHGEFTQKEDLLKVKGIGPAKFANIADRLCNP